MKAVTALGLPMGETRGRLKFLAKRSDAWNGTSTLTSRTAVKRQGWIFGLPGTALRAGVEQVSLKYGVRTQARLDFQAWRPAVV